MHGLGLNKCKLNVCKCCCNAVRVEFCCESCSMLGIRKKKCFQFFPSMRIYSVFLGLHGHSAVLQMCMWGVNTHVHTQSSLSTFTTLGTAVLSSLHSGVVLSWNSPFIFTRSHLGFGLYELTHLSSPHQGMDRLTSQHNVRIVPRLHCIWSIVDTHWVHKHSDSRYWPYYNGGWSQNYNCFASCEVHFYFTMLMSVLEII